MSWLQSLDVALFRFINLTLSNQLFDRIMPFFSGNSLFVPSLMVLAAILIWKAGTRGRVCVVMVALVVCLGDPLVVNTVKHAVGRPRPFKVIADAHVPPQIGKTDSFSMPSAHTANWFAATLVLLVYFRRSVSFMLPLAATIGFSRIYNGMHYPSDVLVGAILGAGYAAALVWSLDALWRWAGQRWFPIWWRRLPSLLHPGLGPEPSAAPADQPAIGLPAAPIGAAAQAGNLPACRATSFRGAGRPQPSLRDSRLFGVRPSVELKRWARLSLRDRCRGTDAVHSIIAKQADKTAAEITSRSCR